VLASLLFGFLRNGATQMMVVTQIPIDIISIIQAFIIVFIAAPALIRAIFRIKAAKAGDIVFVHGWGGK
jgi:simple sugar transport system permease protein